MTPVPDDFAQFAPSETIPVIAKHYGVGAKVVRRWRQECGIQPLSPEKYARKFERPIPPSFALLAPTKTVKELAEYYGAGRATIRKWLRVLCISSGKRIYHHTSRKPMHNFGTAPQSVKHDDGSLAARAADECLRRYRPTYRCNADGVQSQGGKFWRYGNVILSNEGLIAQAMRKGWNPKAWRQVA